MSSSSMIKNIFILIVLVFLTSCGLKMNESPQVNKPVTIQSTQCLDQSLTDLKVFFDGVASDQQVDRSVDCMSKVLLSFRDNVKGASEDVFLPEELSYFVERNFLKSDQKFSKEFLNQIMIFKKTLIGGSVKYFTKSEITELSDLILRLKTHLVKLNPSMSVLTGSWLNDDLNLEQKKRVFEFAKNNARIFFAQIAQELSQPGESYDLEDFLEFIKQAALFSKASPNTIDKIEKAKPFIRSFKTNLIGGDQTIYPSDWSRISYALHEMLFQYLKVDYFVNKNPDQSNEDKVQVYSEVGSGVLDLIAHMLSTKLDQGLTRDQVHSLADTLMAIFSDKKISPDLIDDLYLFKSTLFGEKEISFIWTATDFLQLKDKLPDFLIKGQKIISLFDQIQKMPLQNSDQFPQIEIQVLSTAEDLLSQIKGAYAISSAKRLFLNLNESHLLDQFKLPKNWSSYFDFSYSLKSLILGDESDNLSNSDIKNICRMALKFYLHYTEYEKFMSPYDFATPEFAKGILVIGSKVENSIIELMSFKNSHQYERSEFVKVFASYKLNVNPQFKLSDEGFNGLLKVLFENVLVKPKDRLSGLTLPAIQRETIHDIFDELRYWQVAVMQIAEMFNVQSELSQDEVNEKLESASENPLIRVFKFMQFESAQSLEKSSIQELLRVQKTPVSHRFNKQMTLQYFDVNNKLNSQDLVLSLFSKTLSRIAIRSFAMDQQRIDTLMGVTEAEAKSAFETVRQAVVDLELIESSNTKFMANRFLEANLFMAHSNGDDYASFEELHDIVLHIMSGLKRSAKIKEQVIAIPDCHVEFKNKTEPVSVDQTCLIDQYWKISQGYEGLNEFLKLRLLPVDNSTDLVQVEQKNKAFYLSLLKAAGYKESADQKVKFVDADLFPHVIQYIEMVYSLYDTNRDGQLSKDEALVAFPVFKNIIKKVLTSIPGTGAITDEQLPGVFIYLLKYKKPPKSLAEKLAFIKFVTDQSKWIIQTTRYDMGDILGYIASVT